MSAAPAGSRSGRAPRRLGGRDVRLVSRPRFGPASRSLLESRREATRSLRAEPPFDSRSRRPTGAPRHASARSPQPTPSTTCCVDTQGPSAMCQRPAVTRRWTIPACDRPHVGARRRPSRSASDGLRQHPMAQHRGRNQDGGSAATIPTMEGTAGVDQATNPRRSGYVIRGGPLDAELRSTLDWRSRCFGTGESTARWFHSYMRVETRPPTSTGNGTAGAQ